MNWLTLISLIVMSIGSVSASTITECTQLADTIMNRYNTRSFKKVQSDWSKLFRYESQQTSKETDATKLAGKAGVPIPIAEDFLKFEASLSNEEEKSRFEQLIKRFQNDQSSSLSDEDTYICLDKVLPKDGRDILIACLNKTGPSSDLGITAYWLSEPNSTLPVLLVEFVDSSHFSNHHPEIDIPNLTFPPNALAWYGNKPTKNLVLEDRVPVPFYFTRLGTDKNGYPPARLHIAVKNFPISIQPELSSIPPTQREGYVDVIICTGTDPNMSRDDPVSGRSRLVGIPGPINSQFPNKEASTGILVNDVPAYSAITEVEQVDSSSNVFDFMHADILNDETLKGLSNLDHLRINIDEDGRTLGFTGWAKLDDSRRVKIRIHFKYNTLAPAAAYFLR